MAKKMVGLKTKNAKVRNIGTGLVLPVTGILECGKYYILEEISINGEKKVLIHEFKIPETVNILKQVVANDIK